MSHFITPITIAAVSTALFFFLAGKLEGSSIRYKISMGMMLVGTWMAVASGSLLYIAVRVPVKPMTFTTLTNFALASLSFTLVGLFLLTTGVLVLAWRYSFDVVERAESPYSRPGLEFAAIEGDLSAVRPPAAPIRAGRRLLEPVAFDDSNVREFPERRTT